MSQMGVFPQRVHSPNGETVQIRVIGAVEVAGKYPHGTKEGMPSSE